MGVFGGIFGASAGGGAGDVTAPTITLISPLSGEIQGNTPIVIDAADETDLPVAAVLALYPSGKIEVVHTGVRFDRQFRASTRESLDGGLRYRFTIVRDGGWHERPRIEFPGWRDAAGNLAVVA